MHFQLPKELQTELISYDPKLKALARQNKSKDASEKTLTYRLGQPKGIIPVDVVSEEALNEAIVEINAKVARNRYHIFKPALDEDNSIRASAILYHYENVWYAAWLPPKGKKDKYVYGYSFYFKDTKASASSVPYSIKKIKSDLDEVTIGRSKYLTKTVLVDKKHIIEVDDGRNWNIPCVPSYTEKGRDICTAIRAFERLLSAEIPTWSDTSNIFERIKSVAICTCFFNSVQLKEKYFSSIDLISWTPSFNTIKEMMNESGIIKDYSNILHIIDTPFFRKWINVKCNEAITNNQNMLCKTRKEVTRPWFTIFCLFDAISFVESIWPNCPIDYYQNNIDTLITCAINDFPKCTKEWLNANMPVASFFQVINKYLQENTDELQRSYNEDYRGVITLRFRMFNDTMSMLHRLLINEANVEIPTPRRWRIDEFHDLMQAESWKITTKNKCLPQDLFPTPIKVTVNDLNWTFFQPSNTHQLAHWGQAVRNCVGSASSYADNIKNKKHFIVLCMIDGKPKFTIQLHVKMGTMSVTQIVGLSNQRLSIEENELYSKAFKSALEIRNKELAA